MTSLLHIVLLPISKATQSGGLLGETAQRVFGIEEWLNSPSVIRAEEMHHGLQEDMKRAFAELFRHEKALNLNDFTLLLLRLREKHGIRPAEQLPSPFLRTTFPTSTYVSAYRLVVEPMLAKRLPVWLGGYLITGGELESPSSITLATIMETDLDAFYEYSKVRASVSPLSSGLEGILDDIVRVLRDAKRESKDFFAWSG